MTECLKRQKIREINKMNLSHSEKAKLIFQVMNNGYVLKEEPKKRIYCSHYKRYTSILSKCCNKIYPCRICHDENEDHVINRHDIDYMKCDMCNCLQKISNSCKNPECFKYNKNYNYFCKACNLCTNKKDKNKVVINSIITNTINTDIDIYHCNDCGICRLGKKDDYIHCNKCNLCLKKNIYDNHPCKLNAKEQNCPICLKSNWSTANMTVMLLECGHSVHSKCFQQTLASGNYSCPICKKSMVDMSNYWTMIDNMISSHVMPDEYINWTSDIYCNDCLKKSNTRYHFTYHKCSNCNSFNTVVENINKIIDKN